MDRATIGLNRETIDPDHNAIHMDGFAIHMGRWPFRSKTPKIGPKPPDRPTIGQNGAAIGQDGWAKPTDAAPISRR